MSVKPYSRASSAEVTERWFQRDRFSSAAIAATPRPTYRGVSDSANPGGAVGAVGPARVQRGVPVLLGDAPVVEHHLRAQPARRDGDGGGAERLEFVADGCSRAGSPRPLTGRRRPRSGSCASLYSFVPSVTSTCSPPGRPTSSGSRRWAVIRWVSMPSRRIRRPSSRSCSQIGRFHVGGWPLSTSAPQMSLTRMSMAPWSSRMRSASGLHLCDVEVVDLDRRCRRHRVT